MGWLTILGLFTLALVGCSKNESATGATSNSATTNQSNTTSAPTETPVASNPNIFSVLATSGTPQFFAIPDELSINLFGAPIFPEGSSNGSYGSFGTWGYPIFTTKLRADIAAFEAANPGVQVKRINPVGTMVSSYRQEWIGDPSHPSVVFFRPPVFGQEIQIQHTVPGNIEFFAGYSITQSGIHFVKHLEDQPARLKNFFKYRFCYQATETAFDLQTKWSGRICLSSH